MHPSSGGSFNPTTQSSTAMTLPWCSLHGGQAPSVYDAKKSGADCQGESDQSHGLSRFSTRTTLIPHAYPMWIVFGYLHLGVACITCTIVIGSSFD